MNNSDKEIRRLMVEKGFDSFDDLSDRLNQYPTTDSYEDVVAELAELKLQLINPQPLFTLTAEEVEIVRQSLLTEKNVLIDIHVKFPAIDDYIIPTRDKINNLLTRIKQWQDGNK